MKTLNQKFIFVVTTLLLQSCASLNELKIDKSLFTYDRWKTKEVVSKNKAKKSKSYTFKDTFSDFDLVEIPNEVSNIAKMIQVVQPELDKATRERYAKDIHNGLKNHNINPQIVVALIDVESDFQYTKISTTGDLSIGQINADIWNREYKWMKKPLIDEKKLTTYEQSYAMKEMAKILSVIQKRHEKKDRRWYARYHSNTGKLKHAYLKKIDQRMKMMARAQLPISNKQLALNDE